MGEPARKKVTFKVPMREKEVRYHRVYEYPVTYKDLTIDVTEQEEVRINKFLGAKDHLMHWHMTDFKNALSDMSVEELASFANLDSGEHTYVKRVEPVGGFSDFDFSDHIQLAISQTLHEKLSEEANSKEDLTKLANSAKTVTDFPVFNSADLPYLRSVLRICAGEFHQAAEELQQEYEEGVKTNLINAGDRIDQQMRNEEGQDFLESTARKQVEEAKQGKQTKEAAMERVHKLGFISKMFSDMASSDSESNVREAEMLMKHAEHVQEFSKNTDISEDAFHDALAIVQDAVDKGEFDVYPEHDEHFKLLQDYPKPYVPGSNPFTETIKYTRERRKRFREQKDKLSPKLNKLKSRYNATNTNKGDYIIEVLKHLIFNDTPMRAVVVPLLLRWNRGDFGQRSLE